ncbi:hypothetical protein PCE1_001227 [Barthelona sp. PCE]
MRTASHRVLSRDLTSTFMILRTQSQNQAQALSYIDTSQTESLLAGEAQDTEAVIETTALWVEISEDCNRMIGELRQAMDNLQRLHSQHLTQNFGGDAVQQRIANETKSITSLVGRCRKRVLALAQDIGGKGNLTVTEKMRLNVQKGLVSELKSFTKDFKAIQRDYLNKLRLKEEKITNLGIGENVNEIFDQGFSDTQMSTMIFHQNFLNLHSQEIEHIVKSINDLATLFNDLATLIVDQGSLLDEIDYNVNQTVESIQKGNLELEEALYHTKKMRLNMCLICMLMFSIVFCVILAFKRF